MTQPTLTKTDTENFRNILITHQTDLTGAGRNNWDSLTSEATPDELDRLQNISDRDYAIGNLERNSKRLAELKNALRRIDAGTFGECLHCEEPISVKRLAAVPWAPLCIGCQHIADLATASGTFQEEFSAAA